jgi:hypothetical protein
MKNIYILTMLCLFCITNKLAFNQEYVCQWAVETPILYKSIDNDGNIIITKALAASNNIEIFGHQFSYDNNVVLRIKLDPDLNLIQTDYFVTDGVANVGLVKILDNNEMLLSGKFRVNRDFLPSEFQDEEYTSCCGIHCNSDFNIIQIIPFSGDDFSARDIALDKDGNYYLITNYSDTLHIADTSFTPNDYLGSIETGLLMKYSNSGEFMWGYSAYEDGHWDTYLYIESDTTGNVFVGGNASDYQYSSAYLAYFSSTGNKLSSFSNSSSSAYDPFPCGNIKGLTIDREKSQAYILITSYGPFHYLNKQRAQSKMHFIAKFNASCNRMWDFNMGGRMGLASGNCIFKNDSIYFATMLADSLPINQDYIYGNDYGNLLFGVLGTNGNVLNYKGYDCAENSWIWTHNLLVSNNTFYIDFDYNGSELVSVIDTVELESATRYFSKFIWSDDYNLNQISSIPELLIYPNPASQILTIKANEKISNFSIFNLTGIKIKEGFPISDKTVKINVSDLIPGIYYLQIECIDNTYQKKIIIN